MDFIKLLKENDINDINTKTALVLSGLMASEIMEFIISNSLNKYSGISDLHFENFSNELKDLKFSLLKSYKNSNKDYLTSLVESAYALKRILKIGNLLKGNSDSRLNEDLLIAISLSNVSLEGLISLLRKELRFLDDENIKKEIDDNIKALLKEDEFYKKLMDSKDY